MLLSSSGERVMQPKFGSDLLSVPATLLTSEHSVCVPERSQAILPSCKPGAAPSLSDPQRRKQPPLHEQLIALAGDALQHRGRNHITGVGIQHRCAGRRERLLTNRPMDELHALQNDRSAQPRNDDEILLCQ